MTHLFVLNLCKIFLSNVINLSSNFTNNLKCVISGFMGNSYMYGHRFLNRILPIDTLKHLSEHKFYILFFSITLNGYGWRRSWFDGSDSVVSWAPGGAEMENFWSIAAANKNSSILARDSPKHCRRPEFPRTYNILKYISNPEDITIKIIIFSLLNVF